MSEINENRNGNGLKNWLSTNLWVLICALFVGGAGWGTMQLRINKIETDLSSTQDSILTELRSIRTLMEAADQSDQCQIRTLDKLADRTGVVPPCTLERE